MNQEANCPPEAELRDYCLGKLDPDIWDGVSSHVDACEECQTAVISMDDTHDSLARELRAPSASPGEPPEIERLIRLASAHRDQPGSDREELTHLVHELRTGTDDLPGVDGVLGQYHLLEKLGEGGMGIVYRAEHLRLKRTVAVKILSQKRFTDPTAAERFQREVESLGQLQHPHIVNATDAGDEHGALYLVMEYVDGIDFSRVSDRHGPLSVPDACELIRQAALGLQHAHERGFIHRDIKPANLMLASDATGTPVVKILDLGLARLCRVESAGGDLTETGQVMGTADYMPPEQSTGSHPVDIRSDLYSLGCTFYRLLAGHAPFTGQGFRTVFERMRAHVELVPTALDTLRSDLPAGLTVIVDRLLAKSPDDRFQTPIELTEALEPFTPGCALPDLLSDCPPPSDSVQAAQPAADRPGFSVQAGSASGRASLRRFATGLAAASVLIFAVLWAAGLVLPRVDTPNDNIVLEVDPDAADGEPVSVMALVQRPVGLKGVTSWTIETIEPRGAIRDIAFQPGTGRLATAGDDGSIRIWDAETVQLQAVLVGHDDAVHDIEWSPDGNQLASLSADGAIRIWQTETGKLIGNLTPPAKTNEISWSPSGTRLASRSNEAVVLWEVESGDEQTRLEHGAHSVLAMAWSHDGTRIVTGGSDQLIRIWNADDGTATDTLRYHSADVTQTRWSPDGHFLVSCGSDGRVAVWERREKWEVKTEHSDKQAFKDAAWSPDGKKVAAISNLGLNGGMLAVWSVDTGDWTVSRATGGSTERIHWSPDSSRVALGAHRFTKAVQVHRVDGDDHKLDFYEYQRWHGGTSDELTCVAWSPDGAQLVSGGWASVAIRNGESGQVLQEIFTHSPLGGMKWSPDGTAVAARHANNTDDYELDGRRHAGSNQVFVWRGGKRVSSMQLKGTAGHVVRELAWSPDGNQLATGGGMIQVFDVNQAEEPATTIREDYRREVLDLEWSSTGLLGAGFGGEVEVWNPSTGKMDWSTGKLTFPANEVVWTPDGRHLLIPAGSNVRVYETASGERVERSFLGNGMRAPAVRPDGSWVAFSNGPGRIDLYDFSSGDKLETPPAADSNVMVLQWSTDGAVLHSLRADGTVAAWSPKQNRTLSRSEIPTSFGSFSPDGSRLAFAASNGIRVVDVKTGKLQATLIALRDGSTHFITPNGRTTIGDTFDDAFVYVTVTETGQEMRSASGISPAAKWNTEPLSADLLSPQAR